MVVRASARDATRYGRRGGGCTSSAAPPSLVIHHSRSLVVTSGYGEVGVSGDRVVATLNFDFPSTTQSLSLSLSPPLQRRQGMPAYRGAYLSL